MSVFERAVEEAIFGRKVIEVNIRIKREFAEDLEAIEDQIDRMLKGSWLRRLFTKYKFIEAFSLKTLDMHYVTLRVRADLLNLVRDLEFIEAISQNFRCYLHVEPPKGKRASTTVGKTVAYIKADKAVEVGLTGRGLLSGILDTGSCKRHPMLKGKYKAEQLCFASRGYTPNPDYHTPEAYSAHGPWCASCAGGRRVDNVTLNIGRGKKLNYGTLIGVAPDLEFVNAKVFPQSGATTLAVIYKGIEFAVSQKVDIIQASWGSEQHSQDLHDVINRSMEKLPKLLWVISTGNRGWKGGAFGPNWGGIRYDSMSCPGHMERVLTCGAVATQIPYPDYVADFQSRGPPDTFIVPPGGSQHYETFNGRYVFDRGPHTYPRWRPVEDSEAILGASQDFINHGGYEAFRGSSMGTPHGAGEVAIEKQMHPEYSRMQIIEAIWNSCRPLGQKIPNDDSGYGVPDIEKLISK